MKKTIQLFAFWLAAGCLLAQRPLTAEQIESFKGGIFKKYEAKPGETRTVYRYIDKSGNTYSSYVGLLDHPNLTSEQAIRNFALPPGNTALFVQVYKVDMDKLDAYIGEADGGYYVPDGHSIKFLPKWCLADPDHPYHKNVGDAAVVYIRQGGGKQMVFSNAIDDLKQHMKPIGEPIRVADLVPGKPPTPTPTPGGNGGSAMPIRMNVTINTDASHIQKVKFENGDIPGGIMFNNVSGHIKGLPDIRNVWFDVQRSAFVINGDYVFDTQLPPSEVAELARIAYSFDRRFGVLSQISGINMQASGTLMRTITAADAFLGPIAYGYDMSGNALPDAPKGYVNPYKKAASQARWWLSNWSEVMRQGDVALRGQQPRLFLEFGAFTFSPDVRNHSLLVDQMELQISFQAFTTNSGGKEEFVEKPLTDAEPHVNEAITFFRAQYDIFESQCFDLKRTRYIAATLALLKRFADAKITIQNARELQRIENLEIPYVYDYYADIDRDSDQARWASRALSALGWVPTVFLSTDSKLRLAWLELQYATASLDIHAIARCRKQARALLGKLSEKSFYYPMRSKLLGSLSFYQASGIVGKIDLANRYSVSHPDMAKNYYRAAANYYRRVLAVEPGEYFPHLKLAYVLEKLGEAKAGKTMQKKGFELAHLAADAGDMEAQYSIAFAYLNGDFGTKDYAKAEQYFRACAEQGSPDASLQVGFLVGHTKGYGSNASAALPFFLSAADNDLPEAQLNTALCYKWGLGTAKNRAKARELLLQAAGANNANAQLHLGILLLEDRDTNDYRARARLWVKRAADQGLDEAKRLLKNI